MNQRFTTNPDPESDGTGNDDGPERCPHHDYALVNGECPLSGCDYSTSASTSTSTSTGSGA